MNRIGGAAFQNEKTLRHNTDHDTDCVLGGTGDSQAAGFDSENVRMNAGRVDEVS
jgi:hypothetical protein